MPVRTRSKSSRRHGAADRKASNAAVSRHGTSFDASRRHSAKQSDDASIEHGSVAVLTNPDLLDYADELLSLAEHDKLFDTAKHVYKKATKLCPKAFNEGELPKPRKDMTTDRLYQVILQLMRCGAEHAGAHGDEATYKNTMKQLASRGEHMTNKHHVRITDPVEMARQIIRATRYETEPTHPETLMTKRKGISYKMDAGDDDLGVVKVTRTRAGGQTFKYTYATPTQRDVDHLIDVTAKMRDHVLKKGHF